MTTTQFKALRKGDRVLIPDAARGNRELLSTEVLGIDRLFGKVTVLLGRKPYSYRYVRVDGAKSGLTRSGICVGMCL